MPVWVLRNLPALAFAAALAGSVWWLIDVVNDRTQLRADLAATEKSLTGAKAELQRAAETAQIHRAHLDRAADEARHWAALLNELERMGGRDAPLSALLGATAGRLYGAGR
jgi:chromosome segregation ATPase